MPVLAPRAFVSYSRKDTAVVHGLVEDLRRASVECWMDTLRLQVGDLWNPVIAQEIAASDLFFAYVTSHYLDSDECMKELDQAFASPRVLVVPYTDTVETRGGLPEQILSRVNCGVLGEPDSPQFERAVLELVGRAWASLQVTERMVPAKDHILAGPGIFDTPGYTRADILARTTSELVVAGANLRSWLSDEESQEGLLGLVKKGGKRVQLIMATYEPVRGVSVEGAQHLRQSVLDVRQMMLRLDEKERTRFRVYFHVGAATLSAVFVDPNKPDGVLFFSPRWAIQFLPQDRLSCVIDKRINAEDLYKALYNGVFLMTQTDASTVEEMYEAGQTLDLPG